MKYSHFLARGRDRITPAGNGETSGQSNPLRLEKHPDETFIGRIEKGFDFLGFHFSRDGLRVAKASIRKFVERAARLYEQDRKEPSGSPSWVCMSGDGLVGPQRLCSVAKVGICIVNQTKFSMAPARQFEDRGE